MKKQFVEDYLAQREGVTSHGDRGSDVRIWGPRLDVPDFTRRSSYKVLCEPSCLTPADLTYLGSAFHEVKKLKVPLNNTPETIKSNIGDWVDKALAEIAASEFDITLYEKDGQQTLSVIAITIEGADNLVSAVRMYDRLSYSEKAKELRINLRKMVDPRLLREITFREMVARESL